MNRYEITKNIFAVGVENPSLRIFDIVMTTEYGTSYNSYIVKGNNKTALIETCHKDYLDIFQQNIERIIDLSKIDYVVINHCEPDHTGSLSSLIKKMPNAKILTSPAGAMYLKNITNINDLPLEIVKDQQVIDLGGKSLQFIFAPFLHWPDSMFTYIKEDHVLFSCDFLGSHYCEPNVVDTNIKYSEAYWIALKNYYDAIFGPFPNFVKAGLDKISKLAIDYACTSHGPVLTKSGLLNKVIEKYELWCQQSSNSNLVPIFYTSAYGNTKLIAETIKKTIESINSNLKVEIYDVINHKLSDLQSLINNCKAFCIGSPTLNKNAVPPIWNLIAGIDAINVNNKNVLVFGSYGWSGEALPLISNHLKNLKFSVFDENIKVNFVPSNDDLEKIKEIVTKFANLLK